MMILTTVSSKTSDTSALVFWRTGTKRKGILDVRLDFAHEEADLVAELIAIRYLLFDKQVFDRSPGDGAGYLLRVSKGAIRKLARGVSSKTFAIKFAAFLTGRMKGIEIEVSQSREHMEEMGEGDVEVLDAERQKYTQVHDEIDTPAIGPVLVTRHALERFQARLSTGDPKKPWASLAGRLRNPDLRMEPLDARVARHKVRKYGRADNIEIWSHPDSSLKYLMVVNGDDHRRVLVTVFERDRAY